MNYNNNVSLFRNHTVIHTVITINEVTKEDDVTHHKLQQEKNIMENYPTEVNLLDMCSCGPLIMSILAVTNLQ
jgi:hypothetical protein